MVAFARLRALLFGGAIALITGWAVAAPSGAAARASGRARSAHSAAAVRSHASDAGTVGDFDPLAGMRFYVDPSSESALAARLYPALRVIAREPGTARFGSFSYPNAGVAVRWYLDQAARIEPGTVPMLATYRIVYGHCGNWADPPTEQAAYHSFIVGFAGGIGAHRAVLFLEMDSLITVGCLTPYGVAVRMHELRDAIRVLTTRCPRLVIYLDAGAGDAVSPWKTASLLRRAGVAKIQGFFVNSTHFDWTAREVRYGEEISRLTGGKHFVVNTGENGQGPLTPPDPVQQGNEVLCNPPGRGLGPLPTADTGIPNADAFAWTSNPGESGGACLPGAPPAGSYWPSYAMMLVNNANFGLDTPAIARQAREIEVHGLRHRHRRR